MKRMLFGLQQVLLSGGQPAQPICCTRAAFFCRQPSTACRWQRSMRLLAVPLRCAALRAALPATLLPLPPLCLSHLPCCCTPARSTLPPPPARARLHHHRVLRWFDRMLFPHIPRYLCVVLKPRPCCAAPTNAISAALQRTLLPQLVPPYGWQKHTRRTSP